MNAQRTTPIGAPSSKHILERQGRAQDIGSDLIILLPGELYVTNADEAMQTTLGSCVSACVRDGRLGIGGMNHFMLPVEDPDRTDWDMRAATYGGYAMELLINGILERGGSRGALEAKLFGGANVLSTPLPTEVGTKNITFVERYLKEERIPIVGRDLGGTEPRQVVFMPRTGQAFVRKLPRMESAEVTQREEKYNTTLDEPWSGDVDLF